MALVLVLSVRLARVLFPRMREVGTSLCRSLLALRASPVGDARVVASEQHLRHLQSAVHAGAGEVRVVEAAARGLGERVLLGRSRVAEDAGDEAGDGMSVEASREVSGHYHPKARLLASGRRVSRACFVLSGRRLILPAFGCYTGGLDVRAPALARIAPSGVALLTGRRVIAAPLEALGEPRGETRAAAARR